MKPVRLRVSDAEERRFHRSRRASRSDPVDVTGHDDLERCETEEDVRENDGDRATLVGRYVRIDVRKRPRGDPRYRGHAGVRLADGTTVHLEPTWSPEAVRGEPERERFEGERVEVVGTVHVEPPEPPEPVAYLVAPCVSPVESVGFVE